MERRRKNKQGCGPAKFDYGGTRLHGGSTLLHALPDLKATSRKFRTDSQWGHWHSAQLSERKAQVC